MLPGMRMTQGQAAAAGLTSLSFLASASSTAATITIPAGGQTGDVAILFDQATNLGGGIPTDVTPSGWTGLAMDDDGGDSRARASYKILVGGDPGAIVTGMDGSIADDKLMLVFRGNIPITTVTPSTWLAEVTDVDPASQAINASGQATPLVVLAATTDQGGTAAFSTASPAFDATVASSDGDVLAGYTIYDVGETPVNHTVDMNDLGSDNALVSGYLVVS